MLVLLAGSASGLADVTISSGQTQNISCSGGVCAPTATSATLNVNDLENLLASGNVEVTTTGSGVQAGNIAVDAALSWSNTDTLGLDAYQSIGIDSTISVAGQGGLSLTTNDGGSGGALSFGRNDSVTFASLSSQFTINGAVYMLVGNVSSLASAIASNPSGNYALADNYDASQDGTYSSTPIPTTFTGIVEGLGNIISNIGVNTRHQPNVGGLFVEIGSGGTVADIGLANVKIRTFAQGGNRTASAIGGLAALNYGLLSGDHVGGSIHSAKGVVGGLNGGNLGTISNSYATAKISVASGNGSAAGGGLAGINDAVISGSFATGSVTAPDAGGLVGQNDASISNSYATGSAKGIGKNSAAGGFAGGNQLEISASYSTGKPTGKGLIGGFIGAESGEIGDVTDCYWDATTSGTDEGSGEGNFAGLTGLTTQQLQAGLPAGFDPTIWAEAQGVNNGFPYLIANPPAK